MLYEHKATFSEKSFGLFPENFGNISTEQSENFHRDVIVMEERCQGRWDTT